MATDEEPPDDLRVRLTWPAPTASESSPFDYAGEGDDGGADHTPTAGTPATAGPRPPVGRTSPNAAAGGDDDEQSRRPLGRWAVGRRAAAQRAAEARAHAARAAAERAAAERSAAQQAAAERAEARRSANMSADPDARIPQRIAELREAEQNAARAPAERQSRTGGPPDDALWASQGRPTRAEEPGSPLPGDRGQPQRGAKQEAAERAAAERAAAERATIERAAKERAAADAAAKRVAAEAEAERVAEERAAAERAAAEAAAERAEAERAAEAAERAAAEQEASAQPGGRRPLLTVEAEDDEDDEDEDEVDNHDRGPRTTVTTQELILAGRSDSLQAALASIALRIDALTSTTSTFRNLISDRITDYAEQVGRAAANAAGDLDDYRHVHERALEQIRRSVGEAEDDIRRLGRSVGDLDSKVGALVAAVRESGDAVDQMVADRDQVSDALVHSLGRIEDAVIELTEGKGATSMARLGDMIAALGDERDRQAALWSQMEEVVVALADDRQQEADVLSRLERAINEMATARERGLTKVLARLEARVDEIADAMSGLAGDEVAPTLARLDTRLREVSTELVVGRDRETAKALATLSAQVDEMAGLVAEGRNDLAPIESRLNRLAMNPPAPPVDLAGVYARLDELADVVAQGVSGPSRADQGASGEQRELLARFDQLGQQMGEQLEGLRRRIALRARSNAPVLDDVTISAIADAVVARLEEASSDARAALRGPATPALSRPLPPADPDTPSDRPRFGQGQSWRS